MHYENLTSEPIESSPWLSSPNPFHFQDASSPAEIRIADARKLHELVTRLRTSADMMPLLREVVSAVTQLHGTTMGSVMLFDAVKRELKLVYSQGLPESHFSGAQRVALGTGPCGVAVQTGQRVIIEDLATDERAAGVRERGGLALYKALYSTPLITHSGKIIGTLATFFETKYRPSTTEMLLVDIYARHAAEFIDNARLTEAAEVAQRALNRKAEELEHFVNTIAHDLKQPLRTIAGFTELLNRESGALDPRSQKHLTFVSEASRQMTALINELASYARLGKTSLKRAPVDTQSVVERVVSYLEVPIREQRAEVTFDGLPTVVAEETQLALVFQNLISNAIKFRRKRMRPKVHVSASQTAEGWCFSVRDNGIGISEEKQASLFRIFTRLHPDGEFPGTGIGLASCKKIIERHGGRIWVESEAGKGATFRFVLGP